MNNKELKEVLVGILAIAELLAVEFKDGVQASDVADIIAKIMGNDELKAKLLAAYNDIDKVPSELKSLSVAEAVDLVAFAIPQVISLAGAIKK
jgi:hypothetical protein